jgi:DNA-binding response OmpR family regulator
MAELIARTKALLRRPGGALGTMLKAGNVTFDTIGRNVLVGNVSVLMPRRESAILEHLMRRLGRVVPKTVVCTENLSSGVVVVKSAKDGV